MLCGGCYQSEQSLSACRPFPQSLQHGDQRYEEYPYPRQENVLEIPEDKITEASIIDIALPDIQGNIRRLTDLKEKWW